MLARIRVELRCHHLGYSPIHNRGGPLGLLCHLVLLLVSLLSTACETGPRTFADVEAGRVPLASGEVESLRGLLTSAGLRPWQLGVEGELASPTGNWLEIDDDGHVWALGRTAAPQLDSLAALGGLSRLARVRIRGVELVDFEGLSNATALTHLAVYDSGIESLAGLEACSGLRTLSLSGNRIASTAQLPELPELRSLDLADNQVLEIVGLAGREQLRSLDLSGNGLESVAGLSGLPQLERLNLARNQLVTLSGLRDLPRLRELLVDDNRLVDASAVDALSALELVNLNGNRLGHEPRRNGHRDLQEDAIDHLAPGDPLGG